MSCSFDACNKEGRWQPVLELRVRKKDPPTKARLVKLGYCDGHKQVMTIDDVLSDEGFTKISKFMRERGKQPPSKRNITLVFEELSDTEVMKLIPEIEKAKPDDDWLPF